MAEMPFNTTVETAKEERNFFQKHTVVFSALAVGLVLVGGATLVANKFATQGSGYGELLGEGDPNTFNPETSFSTRQSPQLERRITEEELFSQLANGPERTYATLTPSEKSYFSLGSTTVDGKITYEPSEIDQLLQSVNATAYFSTPIETDDEDLTLSDVYNFLPSGLISTTTPTQRMTRVQADLFDYANNAGSYMESYFDTWGTRQAGILRRYLEDPTDDFKKAEAEELADALYQLGIDLQNIGSDAVPELLTKQHASLVAGYRAMGARTKGVIEAKGDKELLAAINSSNAVADEFAKTYIEIVDIMKAQGVTFSSTDPGRVFAFSSF